MQISDLLTDKTFKTITRNVCKQSCYVDDLHSEATLVVIEKGYDLKEIRSPYGFWVTTVWLTWNSNAFKRKYNVGSNTINIDMYYNQDDKNADDCIKNFDHAFHSIDSDWAIDPDYIHKFITSSASTDIDYYNKNLLRIYVELNNNSREVSKLTKIPYRTVANDIKNIKIMLKENYDKNCD